MVGIQEWRKEEELGYSEVEGEEERGTRGRIRGACSRVDGRRRGYKDGGRKG